MRTRSTVVIATILAGLALSCSGGSDERTAGTAAPTTAATPPTSGTAGAEGWLCHPELVDDPCLAADLRTTVIDWQLTPTVEDAPPATDPAADCIYLPPDATDDATALEWARIEAARFRTVCRVLVPDVAGDAEALGVQFDRYLEGAGDRPFLLVGHGSGADLVTGLVRERIDPDPALRARLVSAMLVGGAAIQVPAGLPVGGTFSNLPLCGAPDQTGCIITFHGFEAGSPPTEATPWFGGVGPGQVAACTSPAGLDGSKGQLRAATFPVASDVTPSAAIDGLPPVDTPFVTLAEYYVAECLDFGGGRPHLWVDRSIDPDDLRVPGPLTDPESGAQGLGIPEHEIALTLGDLLFLAARQIDSSGLGG
jgi:hypothetical protein